LVPRARREELVQRGMMFEEFGYRNSHSEIHSMPMVWRCLLLGLMGCLLAGPARAQRCIDDVVCVETEEQGDDVRFFVNNLRPDDITVVIDVEATNMVADVAFPYAAAYPGRQRTYAFTLRSGGAGSRRYTYRFWWRPAEVDRENCVEDVVCIVVEERDAGLDVFADNRLPVDLTISLEATIDNAHPDVAFPYVATYPPNQRTHAFSARRADPFLGIQYSYRFDYRVGRLHARHTGDVVYALPFAPGKTHRLIQGYNGPYTHQGLRALDFAMPERTPVYAARGGIVAVVEDEYEEGGTEERLRDKANLVIIQHDDGTMGSYVHLARNGAFVQVGQRVAKGAVLGVSGNTGYSSGPHLHFEVFTITEDLERRTLPVQFYLGDGRVAPLEAGRSYTAPTQ
jgi:murein DD-endopeptidase MepM/ murein hydrolase activator NlpD